MIPSFWSKSTNTNQSQRGHPGETLTFAPLRDTNNTLIFQICQSDRCKKDTQWEIATFSRSEKN